MNHPRYEGHLKRSALPQNERNAYDSFYNIRKRSREAGFDLPIFTVREFIGWWLGELKTFNGIKPTCGRIDHSKGYTWDNFILQDMADNSREGAKRNCFSANNRTSSKRIFVYRKDDGVCVGSFGSIRMAARFCGVSQRLIQFIVRGKYKNSQSIKYDLAVQP